jgi:hypothetical protein
MRNRRKVRWCGEMTTASALWRAIAVDRALDLMPKFATPEPATPEGISDSV